MRLLYVVDNSFYDFKLQKPSLVTIRSIVIEHTLRLLLLYYYSKLMKNKHHQTSTVGMVWTGPVLHD